MKQREYLSEDLEQIQRFFPGAKPVAMRTPFDIDVGPRGQFVDIFRAEKPTRQWRGVVRWTI